MNRYSAIADRPDVNNVATGATAELSEEWRRFLLAMECLYAGLASARGTRYLPLDGERIDAAVDWLAAAGLRPCDVCARGTLWPDGSRQPATMPLPLAERKGIAMTTQTRTERLRVAGGEMVEQFKRLLHEGNVRRIVIKHDDHTVAEFPVTLGVATVVLAPMVAAVGAAAAMLTECEMEIERTDGDERDAMQ